MFSSRAVTRGIEVFVQSSYVPEQSEPDQEQWFFAYRVRISNGGDETVQLMTRHWIITDANGKTEEVRGAGVVGKQPVLKPGETFSYTSGCPLPTPSGIMVGTYQMQNEQGEMFTIQIPAFSLDMPDAQRTVN
jgi:ApaG protein